MSNTSINSDITEVADPFDEVLPGVIWGRPEWVFSPAYWVALARTGTRDRRLFRKPDSLKEEIIFCLLGGYGITAELNCAAFSHLKSRGLFRRSKNIGQRKIEEFLSEPMKVGSKLIRYRFPQQRSKRIASALTYINSSQIPQGDALELRDYLTSINGIGPKTASWIVRNWTGTDDVAILDIHVHRAGVKMGVFSEDSLLPRDYDLMEAQFLAFANKISVKPSDLDVLIWSNMRKDRSQSKIL